MANYAVVVGIGKYPRLEAVGMLKNLDGPENDATAIAHWLRDPEGGNVPEENLRLIRTSDFRQSEDDPQPSMSRLSSTMDWLLQQTTNARADRLYLYFAGHGFAPVLEEPALFTAEAGAGFNAYFYAYDWFRYLRQSGRFREYVLWMDCCMTNQRSIPVSPVMARAEVSTLVPGPSFIAVAAQTKSALEYPMSDGQVHGVFTWTLLQGLNGAAADERGVVSAHSLKSYLHDTMIQFLPSAVRASNAVDLRPFVRADQQLVLKRLPAVPLFEVTLGVPEQHAGQKFRLWSGQPHRVIKEFRSPQHGQVKLQLPRGLYVLQGGPPQPEDGQVLRHGFQVTGAGSQDVQLGHTGAPIIPAEFGQLHRMKLTAQNPAASLLLTNHQLQVVSGHTGWLDELQTPGIYKIRVEFGRDIGAVLEHVMLLDHEREQELASPAMPTPAPASFSAFAPASQHSAFGTLNWRFGTRPKPAHGQGALSVLGRFWFHRAGVVEKWPHPLSDLKLLDPHGRLIAALDESVTEKDHDPMAPQSIWSKVLAPGNYRLEYQIPDGAVAQASVVISPGWITQLVIQRESGEPGEPFPTQFRLHDAAVFLRRAQPQELDQTRDQVIESARIALSQGRNLFEHSGIDPLMKLLLGEYQNPMATILGGYLLLRGEQYQPLSGPRAERFDSAIAAARQLAGTEHPDLQVLSLFCSDPGLRHTGRLSAPPVFTAGWDLATRASFTHPELISAALWQQVRTSTALGPFFAWQIDQESRTAHAQQLNAALANSLRELLAQPSVRELSVALRLPAVALQNLQIRDPTGYTDSSQPAPAEPDSTHDPLS